MNERPVTFIIQLGYGKVGTPLVNLVAENRLAILRETGVRLQYAGILRSGSMALAGPDGRCSGWRDRAPGLAPAVLDPVFSRFGLPDTTRYVLVDVTATGQTGPLLLAALEMGIPVVTANKIPLAETEGWFERVQEVSRRDHVAFRYECTVGGSLPVIGTLLDLRRTGDTVYSITALSSSSLSYILGSVNEGISLENAIDGALQRGFTEPNPLIDLAGRDALRKTVILAKTIGLSTGIGDVRQDQLLDHSYPDLDSFRDEGLPRLAERLASIHRPGTVTYYVGTVGSSGTVTLGLRRFPQDSVWGTLVPSENLFLITTERFGNVPVAVRGVGGGPILTAAGVLADIIKAAQQEQGAYAPGISR